MQEGGCGAAPKHYVGNDYETEQFTASTEVGAVVSDWTAVRTRCRPCLPSPGDARPRRCMGIGAGGRRPRWRVPQAAIDRNVRRLLLFAARVGALVGFGPAAPQLACRGQHCYCPRGLRRWYGPGPQRRRSCFLGLFRVTFDDQTPGSTERRVMCA